MPASLNVTDISVLASKNVILNIQRNLSIFSGLKQRCWENKKYLILYEILECNYFNKTSSFLELVVFITEGKICCDKV